MSDDDLDLAAGIGYLKVVVRENGDLGTTVDSEPPEIRSTADHGYGSDLKTPAFDEVRERVDVGGLEAGEHVATIWFDLDEWAVSIEYHVEVSR